MYLQKFIQIGYKLTKGKSLGVDEDNANDVRCSVRAVLECHSLLRFPDTFCREREKLSKWT